MECKQQTTTAAIRQAFACLPFYIVMTLLLVDSGISTNFEPEIISTQDEVIAYVNHTAKLSCIIQNKNRHHVIWSRINMINESQKLTSLLFIDLLKYTPFSRYHLTHKIEANNLEYWNLEIRNIHMSDQGFYSCVLTAIEPISKIFHVKVIENMRNPLLALRSTPDANVQRRQKDQLFSSSSLFFSSSRLTIVLLIFLAMFRKSMR